LCPLNVIVHVYRDFSSSRVSLGLPLALLRIMQVHL
jgi:hypothetical protein